MCISNLLQIPEPWKDVMYFIFPFLPMSPCKTEPTRLAMVLDYLFHCSAVHAVCSSTRKVPLWLSFLISLITWFSGPSGSHLSLRKPPQMLSFLWGKNHFKFLKSLSPITIILTKKKCILFLSEFPYFQLPPSFSIHLGQKAFGHQVSVLIQAMVSSDQSCSQGSNETRFFPMNQTSPGELLVFCHFCS